MKKTKLAKKTTKELITLDIFCNKCGESCSTHNNGGRWDEKKSEFIPKFDATMNEYYGLIELVVQGGYNSTHLDDGWSYRFSLCEGCLRALMNQFIIPVEIKSEYTKDFISENAHEKQIKLVSKEIEVSNKKYRKKLDNKKNEKIKVVEKKLSNLKDDLSNLAEVSKDIVGE